MSKEEPRDKEVAFPRKMLMDNEMKEWLGDRAYQNSRTLGNEVYVMLKVEMKRDAKK